MAKHSTETLPLSPMLFQYLVGLFTLQHGNGLRFDVNVGDTVLDATTGTRRDVDVTVRTPDGEAYAFAGYEVKHWKHELDESHVDALASRLKERPDVTHRAIVGGAGYSKAAIAKAAYHGVELYVIEEWTTPIEDSFPDLAPMEGPPSEAFLGNQFLLTWPQHDLHLDVAGPYFEITWNDWLFDATGNKHPAFLNFANFSDAMLSHSASVLSSTKPMQDRLAPLMEALLDDDPEALSDNSRWPFGHTCEIGGAEVYVRGSDDQFRRVDSVTIQGQLSWEFSPMLYLAMTSVSTGEMFANTLVGASQVPGRVHAIKIPTRGRTIDSRNIELTRDQLDAVHLLAAAPSGDDSSNG